MPIYSYNIAARVSAPKFKAFPHIAFIITIFPTPCSFSQLPKVDSLDGL